jgi:lipid-A-disaccharide synthase-like uncharacterized protein
VIADTLWHGLGIAGGLLFYGRFIVQWIASERRRESVMPDVFWYMSSVGSVSLLAYAVWSQSPLGALGQNLNIVIYGRNITHRWRERGILTDRRNAMLQVLMLTVAVTGVSLTAWTWIREYEINQAAHPAEATTTWAWLAVGVVGQALFASRFLIQWIATERARRSVVPRSFWYFSVSAASLQLATFLQRQEWVFAAGMGLTILIYLRNLWFIHRGKAPEGLSS